MHLGGLMNKYFTYASIGVQHASKGGQPSKTETCVLHGKLYMTRIEIDATAITYST